MNLLRSILRETVLTEVTRSAVERALSSAKARHLLPFQEMFGDALRIVIPYTNQKLVDIGAMIEKADPEMIVDINKGTVTKTIETQRGPRERTERIGRVLNKNLRSMKKKMKAAMEKFGFVFSGNKIDPDKSISVYRDTFYGTPETIERSEEIADLALGGKPKKDVSGHDLDEFVWMMIREGGFGGGNRGAFREEFDTLWGTLGEDAQAEITATAITYRKFINAVDDYNKAGGQDYSIVISRAPIDVLRMSDFRHIQSCHSEGGGYFQCAVAEAQGHGPIGYLVDNQKLKEIDLQAEEIFEDKERGIKGIVPKARLRLRRYYQHGGRREDRGKEFMIPDFRVYGPEHPGFKESMVAWAREMQPEFFAGKLDMKHFTRTGGSYMDRLDRDLWNQFFGEEVTTQRSARFEGEDEEDEEAYNYLEQLTEETEEYDRQHNRGWEVSSNPLASIDVSYEIDEEAPEVHWEASVGLVFYTPLPPKKDWVVVHTADYVTALRQVGLEPRRFDDLTEPADIEYSPIKDGWELDITFQGYGDADDYGRILQALKSLDFSFSIFYSAMRKVLVDLGMAEESAYSLFLREWTPPKGWRVIKEKIGNRRRYNHETGEWEGEYTDGPHIRVIKEVSIPVPVSLEGRTRLGASGSGNALTSAVLSNIHRRIGLNWKTRHWDNIHRSKGWEDPDHKVPWTDRHDSDAPIQLAIYDNKFWVIANIDFGPYMLDEEIQNRIKVINRIDQELGTSTKRRGGIPSLINQILRANWWLRNSTFKWSYHGTGAGIDIEGRVLSRLSSQIKDADDTMNPPYDEEGNEVELSSINVEMYSGEDSFYQQSILFTGMDEKGRSWQSQLELDTVNGEWQVDDAEWECSDCYEEEEEEEEEDWEEEEVA